MSASKDATQNKIIDAAKALFSAKGFAATSISAIAKRAQINQSLIYHHFENKVDLWRAVKSSILMNFDELHESQLSKLHQIETFEAYIKEFIAVRFEIYNQHPELRRIVRWQGLEDDENHLWGSTACEYQKIHDKFTSFINSGEIGENVNIHHLLIMMFALPLNFFSYKNRFPDTNSPESKSAFVALVAKAVVAAAKD